MGSRRRAFPPHPHATLQRSERTPRAATWTLATLDQGAEAIVTGLKCTGPLRRRLLDLGLLPGTLVRRRMSAPSGDPVAYEFRGTVVALRLSTARQVRVAPPSEPPARTVASRPVRNLAPGRSEGAEGAGAARRR